MHDGRRYLVNHRMKYNLTNAQKLLVRNLVLEVETGNLGETFEADTVNENSLMLFPVKHSGKLYFGEVLGLEIQGTAGQLRALVKAQILIYEDREYTLTGMAFEGVKNNFTEETPIIPVSALAHSTPPELNISLDRLRSKYPDPSKLGFLVMRFSKGKPFAGIVAAIKDTAEKHGINVLRADDHQFHADLWGNVRTYLHGCSFGIAVYERIEDEQHNANVGLEVGYLLAMNKSVLLLKERTVKDLQADLMGKLYREFDEHDPSATIPEQLEAWWRDNGVIL